MSTLATKRAQAFRSGAAATAAAPVPFGAHAGQPPGLLLESSHQLSRTSVSLRHECDGTRLERGSSLDIARHERSRRSQGHTVKSAHVVERLAGSIFWMQESMPGNPAASMSFTFARAWKGTIGRAPYDAANPANLLIDRQGGVYFTTDGNFAVNGTADALYYLDLDPAHRAGAPGVTGAGTYGLALRIAAAPSDAEPTGPAFSPDQKTLFLSVQHPGEQSYSAWP